MMTNAFPQVVLECRMESQAQAWGPPGAGRGGGAPPGERPPPSAYPVISSSSSRSPTLTNTTDNAAKNSNILKIIDNKNNMQSVKNSLVLDFTNNFEHKGIAKNYCLISDISLILCVPNLMIRNNCYSEINFNLTKPEIDVVIEMGMTDTKIFGAFPQRLEIQSQSISKTKTVDIKCDYNVFVKCILINQIVGRMPDDSIPEIENAIVYVQGIKYGHPHSKHSFNPNFMYRGSASPKTKSDYAFIRNTRIMSNHSVFNESETVSTQGLALGVGREGREERQSEGGGKSESKGTFKNGDYTFAALLDMVQQAPATMAAMLRHGLVPALRLAGGGESSLNTPSGWGSPPGPAGGVGQPGWGPGPAAPGAGGPQQWGASQRPQPDGNSNKLGGNGVPGSNGGGNGSGNPGAAAGWVPPPPSSQPSAQPPSQGGGSGGGSPGGGGGGGVGVGLMGAGGAAPQPAPTAKAQLEQLNTMRESLFSLDGWGGQHVNQDTNWDVPTSPEPGGVKMEQAGGGGGGGGGGGPPLWKPNINNGTDLWEANLRNGGQPPPQPVAKAPWGHTPTSNIGGTWGEDDDTPESSNVWNGPPPQPQWGAPPQPQHWSAPAKKDDWGGWGEPHRPDLHRPDLHRAPAQDPRLLPDPRARLNGSGDMWGQPPAPHSMHPQKGMMPSAMGNGVNQWGAQAPKDMMGKGASGWEEPSPPAARRNMANFDDGTSLWGQQRGGAQGMGPWKDMGGRMCPPGMPPSRMPAQPPMKPDAMWGHPHRNGSWEDASQTWEKENWSEPMNQAQAWPGVKSSKPSWDADMGEWGLKPPGQQCKPLTKDYIWNSKQFRLLVDMGYKKDDAELALRSQNMNVDEAMDLLCQMRGSGGGMDTWRRHEEPPFEAHQPYPAPPRPHPHQPFPSHQQPPQPPFPQPPMAPALVKLLNQPTSQPPPPPPLFNQPNNPGGGGGGGGGQPSTAQLRMLVQQIQMAVSAGYLNHQILNQPLAPQTLVLLNQLLQQIKVMQQLNQQSAMANSPGNKGTISMTQYSVQMNKTKQQISNLQNQISAQQAIYVKTQLAGGGSSGGDFFNKQHDPITQLQTNFADIAINKDPPSSYGASSGQQSRLNQWKLPSLEKEGEGSEFSRAPGTTSKPTTSPQLNALNLQSDNTWSTGRGVSEGCGWPSDNSDLPDGGVKEAWPSSQQHSASASAYTDLVPEFEPGKPWKMKSMEDDPALTPGSVVRSPLSLAAIKEPEAASSGGKASPTAPSERSLSSSTWSYPPPASKAEAWGGSKPRAPASAKPAWPPSQRQFWPSTWLLLKNLTAQIDGSTLKTLCMQHGPLQSFHLYLNQGIALAKYSSREEANKAQTALNNCVLGNTTIFAESPAESDVNLILQHLGQGGGGGGGGPWRGGGAAGGAPKDSWAFPSVWADGDQRSTPSLSFLPPDLLGGESM